MTGIELYISNQLCDISNPSNFSVYLKREFINPKELSVRDIQNSYSITLPATDTNNRIFDHRNVEESQGKFMIYPDARLYMNGTLILDGKFRLSQITATTYVGNLGVPVPKTASDVFGNTMMNQAGKWEVPFGQSHPTLAGAHPISYYNTLPDAPCIFPLVLYGLLPNAGSDKTRIDSKTRFTLDDLPPSVNCVDMLKKIFANAGYTLTGTAINDERIKKLYVSYKNDETYEMPFNYNQVRIAGSWTNYDVTKQQAESTLELSALKTKIENGQIVQFVEAYVCNLSQANNTRIDTSKSTIAPNSTHNYEYIIPRTGIYKLVFNTSVNMDDKLVDEKLAVIDDETVKSLKIFNTRKRRANDSGGHYNFKNYTMAEVKVVRSKDKLDLSRLGSDNSFYRHNINQDASIPKSEQIFPQLGALNFIDPKHSDKLMCGIFWGYAEMNYRHPHDYESRPENNRTACNPIAMRNGKSWDKDTNNDLPIYTTATASSAYIAGKDKVIANNLLAVDLINAPTNRASIKSPDSAYSNTYGDGQVAQLVWLEKGERISIVSVASTNRGASNMQRDIIHKSINFDLQIEPFRTDKNWLASKMSMEGHSLQTIDWNNTANVMVDKIDLIKFLPAQTKIDEWLGEFSKAFNLQLVHTGGQNFALNIQNRDTYRQLFDAIDLDPKADVRRGINTSLGLPSVYELGFAADTSEHGYVQSMKFLASDPTVKEVGSGYTGGGRFETQNSDGGTKKQTSSFSYCWYKKLIDTTTPNPRLEVPVISDHTVWEEKEGEQERKYFWNKAQRFWYASHTHPIVLGDQRVSASIVRNTLESDKPLELNYEDKENSIMHRFFLLLTNERNYTELECILTAQEYANLEYSLARYNGSLYHIAAIDGYDPLGKRPAKIKLIQRID